MQTETTFRYRAGVRYELRGGCLDGLVKLLSFGLLGIETSVVYGLKNDQNGTFFDPRLPPEFLALSTNEAIAVSDMEKIWHEPKYRIIKNKKTKLNIK